MKNKIIIFVITLIALGFVVGCAKVGSGRLSGKPGQLSNFENIKIWDISPETGFDIKLSGEYVTEGAHSLKVVYPVGGLPSINTKKLPREWGEYDSFAFDVFNPQGRDIDFVVRLDDKYKKRVNIPYILKPGMNNVSISKGLIGRSINASEIYRVVLYIKEPRERVTLYFDNMRLVGMKDGVREGSAGTVQQLVLAESQEMITKETFAPIVIESLLPIRGSIKVNAARINGPISKQRLFVSNGVPFCPGQLKDEKNFAVFNAEGKEIPIAMKVLARWPQDGSIRSLLVQFEAEIPHKYKQLYMRWGESGTLNDQKPKDVTWILPEAILLLPPEWLSASMVTDEQIPFGKQPFPKYDDNIAKVYTKLKTIKWTDNVGKDGYYDTPHVFYQIFSRSGNDDYFRFARSEAVHYRDDQLIQDGLEKGRALVSSKTRYVYVQALMDDYLLTGDERSLNMAGAMARFLMKSFPPEKGFYAKNDSKFWTEREAAFPLLGAMSYYELTGDKECLEYSSKLVQNLYKTQYQWPGRGGFIHNLYSHDTEEGARKDEYGGSPFMTGLLLEGIVKYHRLTNSNIAKDSIFRALDWIMNEGISSDGDSINYLTCDARRYEGVPDLNLLVVHAFGYGYMISGGERKDFLNMGNKLFERGVNSAYLGTRKHFNQNYRSSGHFLSYIVPTKEKEIASPATFGGEARNDG